MPYINTKTTVSLSEEKKAALAMRYGKAIALIPGKSEAHLMLGFEDGVTMYFAGNMGEPMAFIEVKILGTAQKKDLEVLTKEICDILKDELGISGDHVYVKYEEITHWGWNGRNF